MGDVSPEVQAWLVLHGAPASQGEDDLTPESSEAGPARSRAFLGQLGARPQGGGHRVPRSRSWAEVTSASFPPSLRSAAGHTLFCVCEGMPGSSP